MSLSPRGIAWVGGLFIAAIVALSGYDIYRNYHKTIEDTGHELDAHARLIAEQTARSTQAVDVVLRHLATQFNAGALPAGRRELRTYLQEQAIGLVQIEGLIMVRPDGGIYASSYLEPGVEASLNVSSQAAFQEFKGRTDRQLMIGGATPSNVDGQWMFPMARRLTGRDGGFAGVIAARGRIEYFQHFYRNVRLGEGTIIALLRNDGTLLARHPEISSALGKRFGQLDQLMARHAAGPGPTRTVSPVDGVERFGTVKLVADYPLVVVVTRDAETVLAPWREQSLRAAARTLGLAALAAVLLVLLMRQFTRLYKTRESLETSRERYALAVAGSDDGIWDYHFTTNRVFASARARELSGLPPGPEWMAIDEWLGSIPIHPEDEPRRVAARDAHLAGKTPAYEGEWRIRNADGSWRWVRVHGLCSRDASGKPYRMAGSISDIDSRKRAEEALRASEERYALAVAGSDDGIWDYDYAAGRVFASARARELLGLPPGPEMQPVDGWREALPVHPDDKAIWEAAHAAHFSGDTPAFEGEWRMRRPDGSGYRWVRVHGLCRRDADGRPYRMAGSISDIDQRKRAEEALRESQERYALAVAGSDQGVWDFDFVNRRVFGSARARELSGMPPGPDLMPLDEWFVTLPIHPEDAPYRIAAMNAHLEGRTPAYEGEYRIRGLDGAYRWRRVHGLCIRDASGKPLRMAGSISDIDDRKRAEEALRTSEEHYRSIFNAAADALVLRDDEARVVDVNPAFLQISGYTREEVVSGTRWIFALPEMAELARDMHRRCIAGESVRFEMKAQRKDGTLVDIEMRAVPIRFRGKRHALGMARDITVQKRAEAERARLEGQLLQAKKLEAIGTLAGGIAHDFNNILSATLGYGEMAQKQAPAGSALRRHIDAVVSAGMRAKSLVERILAFSRSGVGERAPVHVRSVVDEALDLAAAALPSHVRLEREMVAAEAAVMGDATQIHQVVMNLCANAAQAMKSAGVIQVTLDVVDKGSPERVATSEIPAGRYVRLAVRDSGSGIAPQVLERIFDPFFTTKGVGVGTGLGLSLVHGIVTDLGGGIDVESTPGQGSCFTVYLPWTDAVAAAVRQEEPLAHGAGETVLLVDDEEALVRLGEEMIAALGYEPVGFSSSSAALAAFRAEPNRFHAVLSDEAMPEMTGSEMAREIRALRPDIPLVLMSGFVTPALSARARELGAYDVLSKPLVARDIARALAGALQSERKEAA